MLGWIVLFAACIAMYRIAEMGDRRGWVWAIITFVVCFACSALIPLPLLNLGIGFILSYGIMIAASLMGGGQPAS